VTDARPDRYHRQMLLPGWGAAGQQRLAQAHAAIVGVGALGSVVAEQLARAGVGTLTLIDRDIVELTNLQRQFLYAMGDLGSPKVEAARDRLTQINPDCRIYAEATDLRADNAEAVLGIHAQRPAVIIDGTDNFETRYLLNDLAVLHAIPLVYGGALATGGTQMTVLHEPPGRPLRPCLRCVEPEPPPPGTLPTCDTAGVLGPATAVIASIQAAEAIRIILGIASDTPPSLVQVDLFSGQFRRMSLAGAHDPACPCCVRRQFPYLAGTHDTSERLLCGRNTVQISPPPSRTTASRRTLDLAALAARTQSLGPTRHTAQSVSITLAQEAAEVTVFADGRILVSGTTDPARARALAARIMG
jgi:adenylyltransferase/sulfurtransferase